MSSPMDPSRMNESPYEKMLAEISEDKWGYYKNTGRKIENRHIANVQQMDNPANTNRVAGLATADAAGSAEPQMRQVQGQLMRAGEAPNSGKFVSTVGGMRGAAAGQEATASLGAKMGVRDAKVRALEGVVGLGNSQAQTAQAGLMGAADIASAQAKSKAEMDTAERLSGYGAVGSAAGLAAGGVSSYLRR